MSDDGDRGEYVCLGCDGHFSANAIKPNQRDDYVCPACGSLRMERARSRLQRLYAVLVQYNRN